MTNPDATTPDTAAVVEQANLDAVFHPYVHADDNNGATGLPCIEIGGVQVYVYLDVNPITGKPRLRVSPHFDTADLELFGSTDVIDYEHSTSR